MKRLTNKAAVIFVTCLLFLGSFSACAFAWPCYPPCDSCERCVNGSCIPCSPCCGGICCGSGAFCCGGCCYNCCYGGSCGCPGCCYCVGSSCVAGTCTGCCVCSGCWCVPGTCPDCYSCASCNCQLDGTCMKCSGYEHWSDGPGGTPPDCTTKVSTRTLGDCVASSNPDDTCTEGTHYTRHVTTYMPEIDPFWESFCFAEYLACIALVPPVLDCWDIYQDCLDSHTECTIVESFYDTPQTGCTG